jgi:hypothetical protein
MKRLLGRIPWGGLVCAGLVLAATATCPSFVGTAFAAAPADDAALKEADHVLVAALAKGDKALAEKMFDTQLTWTTSAGETLGHAKVVAALPKPMLGDEGGAQVSEKGYGSALAAVQVASGKMHVLRIWAKRPAGWRLLIYQEVTQRSGPAPAAMPTTNDCENPCKGVPYTAKNDAEKGILKSWAELETAVLHHDAKGWTPHVLDDFVLISSGAAEPADKAFRLKQLNTPGVGPAPPTLAKTPAVRFIHFGDSVVMIAQANPYAGKPNHITRIWVKGPETWQMAFSYQTTIQSAAMIMPPKS